MADSSLRLTKGQLKVLELAESGHNVCVVGKAGVGKSTVVLTNKKTVIERKNVPHCELKSRVLQ